MGDQASFTRKRGPVGVLRKRAAISERLAELGTGCAEYGPPTRFEVLHAIVDVDLAWFVRNRCLRRAGAATVPQHQHHEEAHLEMKQDFLSKENTYECADWCLVRRRGRAELIRGSFIREGRHVVKRRRLTVDQGGGQGSIHC